MEATLKSMSNTVMRGSKYIDFAKTTRKVACIGRNYVDHIKELGNKQGKEPFFFLKPPTSLVEPGDGPCMLPKGVKSHFEIELGFVMGARVKDFDDTAPNATSKAIETIGGYFLAIDMTARNIQEENKKKGLPWTTAKGFDSYLPVSKFIPKEAIKDPHNVRLSLKVNQETKQDDNTNLMIYQIPKIIGHISSIMTLEEGDIVITGTPKGVGRVVDGDVMSGALYDGETGQEIKEGKIEIKCQDRVGGYVFSE